MRQNLAKIAREGQGGDSLLGHLSKGDIVVPVEKVTPGVKGLLSAILGAQTARFTAGNPANRRNGKSGLIEFDDGADSDNGDPGQGNGDPGGTAPGGAAGQGGFSGNDKDNGPNDGDSTVGAAQGPGKGVTINGPSVAGIIGAIAATLAGPAISAVNTSTGLIDSQGKTAASHAMEAMGFSGAPMGSVSFGGTPGDVGPDSPDGPAASNGQGGNAAGGQAGLLTALAAPTAAPATPAVITPPAAPIQPLGPFWWQRAPRTLR